MAFKVNTIEFRAALEKAARGAAKKSVPPALENVLIAVRGGVCSLTGGDLTRYAVVKIDAAGDDGAFVFSDTRAALKALKFFSGADILFDAGPNAVKMASGTKKAEVLVLDPDIFPEVPAVDGDRYVYDAGKLAERFNRVAYAVMENESRPVYTGVHFKGADMVSCDSHRLALNTDAALSVTGAFTVPAVSLKLAADVLAGPMTVTCGKKHVAFETAGATIVSRLLDGDFLDYRRAIPQNNNRITVNVKDFAENINYLKTFAQKGLPMAWNNSRIANISSQGRYDAEISLTGSFGYTIGFDMEYMLDALGQFKGAKTLDILMPERNVIGITMLHGGDLAVLLPVRLKEGDPFAETEDGAAYTAA